jgi:multiple sugar transport system permease protein
MPSEKTERQSSSGIFDFRFSIFNSSLLYNLLLTAIAFTLTIPFMWMVLTSLKTMTEVGLTSWWPMEIQWSNYSRVFDMIPFARWYWNSILVAACTTAVVVLTSSMAAFSFSRLEWPGRDKVFLAYLGTMMLPGLVTMIPNYQIMVRLALVDTYLGLIIPASFSAYGTFLLRQFMMGIPRSLDEAAEIDGASKWQLFWDVIMPLTRPGLVTLSIFTFMGAYGSFFWPLVMLKTSSRYTLPIGMLYFESERGTETSLLMAAITMSVIPSIVVFVCLQKKLIKGIQLGGVKG